ncbi:hypothetical protein Bbelb_035100 [Branchiostoma belcheri]|nr:hypothetical protein Bbelb_035100 [Branchiostoma belcheri]
MARLWPGCGAAQAGHRRQGLLSCQEGEENPITMSDKVKCSEGGIAQMIFSKRAQETPEATDERRSSKQAREKRKRAQETSEGTSERRASVRAGMKSKKSIFPRLLYQIIWRRCGGRKGK